jgi:hypothetical protein
MIMKNITLLITFYCLLSALSLKSQWTDETNFNQVMTGLQEFNGELFIGGNFTKRNNVSCYWSARYNGSQFTNQPTALGGGGLKKFTIFDGDLYATGSLYLGAVVKWSGSTWVEDGNFNSSHTGIFADGNDLYVGSDFGVVSKKTGTGIYNTMSIMDNTSDDINAITKYNGDIYIAGKLNNYNAVDLNNIGRWDGSAWQPLGSGLSNEVKSMVVYKSELYVAGTFTTAGGQSAKSIAKWNGTSWSNVGGSMTGTGWNGIRDMIVYNNTLIVVGDFTEMGGVTTSNVAMWNGTSWKSLDLTTPSSFANCIGVFNNRLYVGTFDFTETHLYSRDASTVGIKNLETVSTIVDIYPNPSHGVFNIELGITKDATTVEVINSLGRIVLSNESIAKDFMTLDMQTYAKGIYFIKVTSENKTDTKKVILN